MEEVCSSLHLPALSENIQPWGKSRSAQSWVGAWPLPMCPTLLPNGFWVSIARSEGQILWPLHKSCLTLKVKKAWIQWTSDHFLSFHCRGLSLLSVDDALPICKRAHERMSSNLSSILCHSSLLVRVSPLLAKGIGSSELQARSEELPYCIQIRVR